jgi:membrane protein implicated in regulation of membrane protease activity
MIEFLSEPNSGVFVGSLGVTFLLCVVEGISLALAGTTTPSFMDLDDSDPVGSGPLNYLNAGHLPLTLLVASAAAMFGIAGFGLQQSAAVLMGHSLPLLAAIPIAAIAAIPSTHLVSRGLGSLLPKTETTAISADELLGLTGTVMAGIGKRGQPVQVRLRDQFSQSHYVQVEPVRDDETFTQGQMVQLTCRDGPLYLAIASLSLLSKEL